MKIRRAQDSGKMRDPGNEVESFHVIVLQRTAKKCTKIQNARAWLIVLLLGDALVAIAVAVVVC